MEKEYEKVTLRQILLKCLYQRCSCFQERTTQRFHLHPEQSCDKAVKVHRIQLEQFSGKRIMIPDNIRANYCELF